MHQFHLSILLQPIHDALILCTKRRATRKPETTHQMRRHFQEIPSNWFPEITLCGCKLWRSIQWKKRVCAWEEIFTCSGEDETWGPVLIHVTDGTMKNLHFKEIPFFFSHAQEKRYRLPPHTRQRVIRYDVVKEAWKSEPAHKILKWLHIEGLNLMRNYVKIGEHYSVSLQALVGSTVECIVGRCQAGTQPAL